MARRKTGLTQMTTDFRAKADHMMTGYRQTRTEVVTLTEARPEAAIPVEVWTGGTIHMGVAAEAATIKLLQTTAGNKSLSRPSTMTLLGLQSLGGHWRIWSAS